MSLKKKPNFYESMAVAGTTAVISVNFTHPLDLFKTRLQADKFNLKQLIKEEGVFSFWKGIKAAYLREATYTSTKLGCYAPIKTALKLIDKLTSKNKKLTILGGAGHRFSEENEIKEIFLSLNKLRKT